MALERFLQTVGLPNDVGNGGVPWCSHYTSARSFPLSKNKQQKPLQEAGPQKGKSFFNYSFSVVFDVALVSGRVLYVFRLFLGINPYFLGHDLELGMMVLRVFSTS